MSIVYPRKRSLGYWRDRQQEEKALRIGYDVAIRFHDENLADNETVGAACEELSKS